jgi:CRP-like cAMP-binding protein
MEAKLDQLPIFQNIPAPLVARVLKYATTKEYRPGDLIIREGDPGQEFFVVLSGHADLTLPGGEETAPLGPGSAFGEIALIERVKRTASVRARDAVKVVVLEKKFFDLLFLPGSEERRTLTQNIRTLKRL